MAFAFFAAASAAVAAAVAADFASPRRSSSRSIASAAARSPASSAASSATNARNATAAAASAPREPSASAATAAVAAEKIPSPSARRTSRERTLRATIRGDSVACGEGAEKTDVAADDASRAANDASAVPGRDPADSRAHKMARRDAYPGVGVRDEEPRIDAEDAD